MRRLLVGFFAVIGFLTVLTVGLGVWGISHLAHKAELKRTTSPDGDDGDKTGPIILQYRFTGTLPEGAGGTGLTSGLFDSDAKLREIVEALDRGAADSDVKGLLVVIQEAPDLAQVQELRDALARFRAAGKFAYAFADTLGGDRAMDFAAGFEQVWLQPMGAVELPPIVSEQIFLRDALGSIGIKPQVVRRAEYKTFFDQFAENGFTAANREMTQALIDDLQRQLVEGIATGRNLTPDTVRALVGQGPVQADQAVAQHLVDHVGYLDQAKAAAIAKAGGKAKRTDLADYAKDTDPPADAAKVALITLSGALTRSSAGGSPLTGDSNADVNEVVKGFDKAMRDKDVKGIVFRVDSPGGEVPPSETVRHAVDRAQAAGKPVVVSMGATGASGGYWLSTDAKKIVAQPATLTGSIGVVGGGFAVGEALDQLKVAHDYVASGPNPALGFKPWTPEQRAIEEKAIQYDYDQFKQRVAAGRHLDAAKVEQIARGRVWTGAQAKPLGLVDALGGVDVALTLLKAEAQLAPDAAVKLVVFPAEKNPLQLLADALSGKKDNDVLARLGLSPEVRALLTALAPLAMRPEEQAVRMAPPELR